MTMFRRKAKESIYDESVKRVLAEMTVCGPDSDTFPVMLTHMERITELKKAEEPTRRKVSPDTMAIIMGTSSGS